MDKKILEALLEMESSAADLKKEVEELLTTTRPDDYDINAEILEMNSFNETLFSIADKYEMNLTNNYERWQDGVYLREIGDFISDIYAAVYRHLPEIVNRWDSPYLPVDFKKKDNDEEFK